MCLVDDARHARQPPVHASPRGLTVTLWSTETQSYSGTSRPSIHGDGPTNALLEAYRSMSPSDAVDGELSGVGVTVAIRAEICRQPTARRPVIAISRDRPNLCSHRPGRSTSMTTDASGHWSVSNTHAYVRELVTMTVRW